MKSINRSFLFILFALVSFSPLRAVEVTVYNKNMGVIKENRTFGSVAKDGEAVVTYTVKYWW